MFGPVIRSMRKCQVTIIKGDTMQDSTYCELMDVLSLQPAQFE